MTRIEQVSFSGPLGTLRGILHRPATDAGPAPVVVLLHGFTGNHVEDQFLFAQAARALAGLGWAALRFDFYGSGDSDGTFEECSVLTETADAVAALDWVEKQPGIDPSRIAVLGLSMGGYVTALLAGQDPRVKAVVFWNAVGIPDRHFVHETDHGRHGFDVGAVTIGLPFVRAYFAHDPAAALRHYSGPGLVIQATADLAVSLDDAEALAAALGGRATLRLLADADHTFKHPALRLELFEITARWLHEYLMS